jgi:hypothetical protein
MRYAAVLLTLSLAVLFAQSGTGARKRSRGRADAGLSSFPSPDDGGPLLLGPDTPGRIKVEPPARDGGLPDGSTVAPPDGGGSRSSQQAQIEELRGRISVLEQQATAAQQQAQEMRAMNEQLQALRQQLADADARRQQEQADEQRHRQAVQSAMSSLAGVQQQLLYGNSSDASVDQALDQAQSTFTGQAQRDVQAARMALRNNDVSAARAYLSTAMQDAQAGR